MKACCAVNVTNSYPYKAGEPCGDDAQFERDGHPCCYTHKNAVRPIEWVDAEAVQPLITAAE